MYKTDGNRQAIVDALKQAGCSVQSLESVGQGCPDLLVGRQTFEGGRCYLLELKQPKADLNKRQVKWHQEWKGHVVTVRTPEEALIAIGLDYLLPRAARQSR